MNSLRMETSPRPVLSLLKRWCPKVRVPGIWALLLLLCLGASVGSPNFAPSAVLAQSSTPAAYWRLEEGAGTTAQDSTSNGNTGSINGATYTTDTPTLPNSGNNFALLFDATDSHLAGVSDHYVSVPAGSGTNLNTFANGITLESFVKPASLPISGDPAHDTQRIRYIIWADDGAYELRLITNDSTRETFIEGGVNFVRGSASNCSVSANALFSDNLAGTFSHVALTYDDEELRLYLDGMQVAQASSAGGCGSAVGPVGSRNVVHIGSDETAICCNHDRDFLGVIDEVRVTGRPLDPSEFLNAAPGLTFTAPKWLDTPEVDGKCDDPAYAEAGNLKMLDQLGESSSKVAVLHSTLDLYLCFSDMPAGTGPTGAGRLAVLVDSDHSGGNQARPGDYQFSVTPAGERSVTQGSGTGAFVSLAVPDNDFTAAVAAPSAQLWNAEMRISLEWLGGYARTDGLNLALEGQDGETILQRWPQISSVFSPDTWGDLVLAPLYPEVVTAGSAFLDGRQGYLVVPYSPRLNPQEITIESWVRVVGNDCGTLVGNGQATSYWMGLCDSVRLGIAGEASVSSGSDQLGEGWHHVAATMDAKGVRTLYLDGEEVARPGYEMAHEIGEDEAGLEPARLGISDRMLRIGSDRDALEDLDRLHGYVRELRIWDHARSAHEIRDNAFASLTGSEAGLLGLWPFANGLEDIANGHDGGLIGNASLAQETPDVTNFPAPPPSEPYPYPDPVPVPPWDALVPAAEREIVLDGPCRAAEYDDVAASVPLEPNRLLRSELLLTKNGLHLCTNVLFGSAANLEHGATLWLDRSGQGGPQPGQQHLRVRLRPDGEMVVGTGNGEGYGGPGPDGLSSAVVSDDRFVFQEDLLRFDAPWWSGEVQIPLEALAPFKPGDQLLLGIRYDGAIPPDVVPNFPEGGDIRATWPADFDDLRPDTWGKVATQQLPKALDGVSREAAAADSNDRTPVSSALADHRHSGGLFGPQHVAPSRADFYHKCPASPGDDINVTINEGVSYASYAFDKDAKWPAVDPTTSEHNHHVVQAAGILEKVYVSPKDSVFIHDSHDLDMNLTADQPYRWLSLFTDEDTKVTTSGGPILKLETESLGFPPHRDSNLNARPKAGDHVTAVGRWIFDCGHWPKTEIHPIAFFESDREEVRPVWPGGPLKTVRVVRVWMNSDPKPFQYSFDGPLDFFVKFPPPGWMPFIRVVNGDPSKVTWTVTDNIAHITIDPPAPTGTFFLELILGHLDQPEDSESRDADIFTISFNRIDILNDRDSGIVPDCDPGLLGISSDDCGEWHMSVNVNGVWRQLFWDQQVNEETDDEEHPNPVPLDNIPAVQLADRNLTIQVTAYEDDDILHSGGEALAPDPDSSHPDINGFPQGRLADLAGSPQSLPSQPFEYRLHYNVASGGTVPSSLADEAFWQPFLADEPNDTTPASLDTVPVPPQGAAPLETAYTSYLLEGGERLVLPDLTNMELLDADVDRYQFALDDFADITFGSLPPGLLFRVDQWNSWHDTGSLPQTVRDRDGNVLDIDNALGHRGARVRINSEDGDIGRQQYTLGIRTTYKVLPEDWGEDEDEAFLATGQGSRLVDLATVPPNPVANPNLSVKAETMWHPEMRHLEMDWAWQHDTGDVDYYEVVVLPVDPPPPGHTSCRYDQTGRLIVRAYGMDLELPDQAQGGGNVVILGDLASQLPGGGSVAVEVRYPDPSKRDFYRFSADWDNSRYYSESECDELRRQEDLWKSSFPARELELIKGIIEFTGGRDVIGPRGPRPDPSPTELFALGSYRPIFLADGEPLDMVISGEASRPVIGRLYNQDGVLLGESMPLNESAARRTLAPDAQAPQQRLRVNDLRGGFPAGPIGPGNRPNLGNLAAKVSGQFFFLQLVPDFNLGDNQMEEVLVGASESDVVYLGECGDQNGDGEVNISDAIIDLQIIVGLIKATEKQRILGDVVSDGQINNLDVILTLQHISGLKEITECGPLPA